jgi:signal transduction histidine kinase/ActR/RegA family two-component response regulator
MDATQDRKVNHSASGEQRRESRLRKRLREYLFGDGRRVRRTLVFTLPTIFVATLLALAAHQLVTALGFSYDLKAVAVVTVVVTTLTATPLIGYCVDIVWHLRKTRAKLKAAVAAAETANASKSAFLANMSHEIRTPLNGVLGMAQAMEAQDLDPASREMLATIRDSGATLMAILNDVLDLSKIEAGKLDIAPIDGDLVHTLSRVRKLFQPKADEKHLTLSLECDADIPSRLCFDPVRVRQCVSNLVSNAVKFTSRGAVRIKVAASSEEDGQRLITIAVIDQGIGISPEPMSNLFEAFSQADTSTTRTFGGTGLGLVISRRLARLMGGDIAVESEPGKGSTFTFSFIARAAQQVEARATEASSLDARAQKKSISGARILLTDDNSVNRQIVRLFLQPQGAAIVEAANGKEALDRLAAEAFDLVLLDVHMPVMDGVEAIQRIRSSDKPWSSIPVLALTADAMSGDRERLVACGMSGYVSKPIDQRELLSEIGRMLGGANAPPARSKPNAA